MSVEHVVAAIDRALDDPLVSDDAMRWAPDPHPKRLTQPYIARRDHRFAYSTEAIEHVEQVNCSRGCRFGAAPGSPEHEEFGPGGTCGVLALVACGMGDEIPVLEDDGATITCTAREGVDDSGGTLPLFEL